MRLVVELGLLLLSGATCLPRATLAVAAPAAVAEADSLARGGHVPAALATLDRLLRQLHPPADAPTRRRALLLEARLLALSGHSGAAEAAAREALAGAEATGDSAQLGEALRWMAYGAGAQGRVADAAALWSRLLNVARARGDRERVGYAHYGLGYAAQIARDLPRARREYAHAAEVFRALELAPFDQWALAAHASACASLGDFGAARAGYREAIALGRRRGDAMGEGRALNDLGALEFEFGDPALALGLYERALVVARGRGDAAGALTPLRNVAVALTYLGHLDDAAARIEEGLGTSGRLGLAVQTSELLEQLAYVRGQQVRLHEATRLFRRCIALDDSLGRQDNAEPVLGLAACLGVMDSTDAALELLRTRLEPRRGELGEYDRLKLDRQWAERLEEAGRYPEALAHSRAVERAAQRLGVASIQFSERTTAARCERALGRPDRALAQLRRGARDWEELRTTQREPEWRERLGDERRELYTELADLLIEYPAELPAGERIRRALEAVQRFKARTLYERARGPAAAPLPPAAYEAVGLRELQTAVLRPGEALVDAYIGRRLGIVFIVTRDTCLARRVPIAASGLGMRLRRFREYLATPPAGAGLDGAAPGSAASHSLLTPAAKARRTMLASAARGIRRELFGDDAPWLARQRRLLFCLDGPLTAIPPGVLIPGSPEAGPLIGSPEVVVVPSATLLAESRRSATGPLVRKPGALLLLASGSGPGRTVLRGAEREARWLAGRFTTIASESLARIAKGPDSAPPRWLRGCAALHVAAHTELDDQRPWRSGIRLPGVADASGDSLLRAGRIALLRLPVGLAVLSACETAGQRAPSGEGMLGLSSGFLASGIPAVVASLWPVSDLATAQLMEVFYDGLDRGLSVAAALRRAQLALAGRDPTRDPFYWAGFVVIGEGDARAVLRRRRIPSPANAAAALVLALGGIAAVRGWRRRTRVTGRVAGTPML